MNFAVAVGIIVPRARHHADAHYVQGLHDVVLKWNIYIRVHAKEWKHLTQRRATVKYRRAFVSEPKPSKEQSEQIAPQTRNYTLQQTKAEGRKRHIFRQDLLYPSGVISSKDSWSLLKNEERK